MVVKSFLLLATGLFLSQMSAANCVELVERDGVVFEVIPLGITSSQKIDLKSTFGDTAVFAFCGKEERVTLNQVLPIGTIVEIGFGYVKVEFNDEVQKHTISW